MGKKTIVVTLLSFRASTRCWAPCSLIWLLSRSSAVSVCLDWEMCVWDEGKENYSGITWFFLIAAARYSECLFRMKNSCVRWMKWIVLLLHCRLEHQLDAVHQRDWFDCGISRVQWVSVCNERYMYEIDEERNVLTSFFLRASARYCAPWSPIWFLFK
jgi:hypothetical protein